MLRRIYSYFFLLLLLPASLGCADSEQYKAGVHYEVLPQVIRTANPNKIEVNEVFAYTCGHCYNFEAVLHPWQEALAEDVDMQRTPAVWNLNMEVYARAYYSGLALKVLDKVHMSIFEAIHVRKEAVKTEQDMAKFFIAAGIDSVKFFQVFNSFGMTSMVNQGKARMRGYRTQGTPEIVVNGKYRVSSRMAGGFSGMLKVADFLIEKERATAAK
jgi:protein dithiol oxidoreductase (disulfide-forming)